MTALRFPPNFPPTGRWKRFFIGVRWLDPDLSFFKEFKRLQAERNTSEMAQWGGGGRQALAESVAEVLSAQLRWQSTVFLPDDSADVAFHGPSFDFNDPEDALAAVIKLLERDFGIKVPESFWESHGDSTMGALIDDLLAKRNSKSV